MRLALIVDFEQLIPVPTFNRPWFGHHPITQRALEALSTRWSCGRDWRATRTEKVLYIAAAFWSAVAMDTLDDFFGDAILEQMRNAREACVEIGANALAVLLQRKLDACAVGTQAVGTAGLEMQAELLRASSNMDELIARYADKYLRENPLC
jgi:hypothetical protein